MRVLMLDNEFPPLGGGTGVVNWHLLQEMSAYDLGVDLVTSSRTRDRYDVQHFGPGITIYRVPVDNKNIHHSSNQELLRYAWRGLVVSRRLVRQHRYDLSFAFAGVPAGAMSYALKATAGLPYVVSLQGPDVPGFEARYGYIYPVLKPLLRAVWRNAAAVIAISKEHQRLAHQTVSELDISIIPNGVNPRVFRPADAPHQSAEVNILCVGRLIERKGQHVLLRAFARLRGRPGRPIRLTLVGTGDAERSLRLLAADLGIADLVSFAGFVPRDSMPDVYRKADIFALPSQSEGMSVALLEAMASGLPVIVTDTGGTGELVQNGVNGFVIPWGDETSLSDSIGDLVGDAELRRRMGFNSRTKSADFDWSVITQEYVHLLHKVAGASRSKVL
jgi:phosphatidylinositol alpha-1,6-mannosyltransferase